MLGLEKRIEAELGVRAKEAQTETPAASAGKFGMIAAIALALVVIFSYMLIDLRFRVDDAVTALAGKTSELDKRLARVENLPQALKKTVMNGYASEIAQKAAFLGTQAETPEQRELLRKLEDVATQLKDSIK